MGAEPIRAIQAYAPRLMGEAEAARYLSIGTTTLRKHGPQAKRLGRRILYDVRDLDRWADALDGQPLTDQQQQAEAEEVERKWREGRQNRAQN